MAARKTKAEKAIDARINAAFNKVAYGIVIPMMAIPKIYAAGKLVAADVDDETLELIMAGAIDAVRVG